MTDLEEFKRLFKKCGVEYVLLHKDTTLTTIGAYAGIGILFTIDGSFLDIFGIDI